MDLTGLAFLQQWNGTNFFDMAALLIIYALLVAVYALFVWSFYKSISKRDLFTLKVKNGDEWKADFFYMIKYILGFPVFTFLWFAGFSIVLSLLSKSQSTTGILVIAMALITAIRISAYFREEIAAELAKILPLGVLAIFIVDPTYFSLTLTMSRIYEMSQLAPLFLNYLLFAAVLEFLLRFAYIIKRKAFNKQKKPEKKGTKKK